MQKLFALVLLTQSFHAYGDEVLRISVGHDYKSYSQADLQRRVWDLERAVWQLQQKVFQLEAKNQPTPAPSTWICKMEAVGNVYTATGITKAEAMGKVTDACKAGRGGDGFFCKEAKCEQ